MIRIPFHIKNFWNSITVVYEKSLRSKISRFPGNSGRAEKTFVDYAGMTMPWIDTVSGEIY